MEYQQLMISDMLSESEQAFKRLHVEIVSKGSLAAECLVDMCKSLKEMRDKQLYACAGFDTFEDYTEKALNIGRRQAYSYISTLEKLSGEFVQSTAHLGITKLSILASMSGNDRDELMSDETVDLANISVKELEQLKADYESRITQLSMDLGNADNAGMVLELGRKNQELSLEIAKMSEMSEKMMNTRKEELEKQKAYIAELEIKLKEKPKATKLVEPTVVEKIVEKEVIKEVEKIVEVADGKTLEELEQLKAEYQAKQADYEQLQKQIKLSDSNLVKFKTLFCVAKTAFENVLEHINGIKDNEEQKSKCIAIVNKLCDGIKSELGEVKHE